MSFFPADVVELIVEYAKQYELIEWAHQFDFKWEHLARNPNSIDLLRANPNEIHWSWLSSNRSEAAIQLLSENLDKVDWHEIVAKNSGARNIINVHPDRLTKYIANRTIFSNRAAIDIIRSIPLDKIDWIGLGSNANATDIILANAKEYDAQRNYVLSKGYLPWDFPLESSKIALYHRLLRDEIDSNDDLASISNCKIISCCPSAINWLRANPDKIDWEWLSGNPAAIDMLEANLDKVSNAELSMNPSAIPLLQRHPKHISTIWLARNPSIFELRDPLGLREFLTSLVWICDGV